MMIESIANGMGVDAHCHIDLFPEPVAIATEIQRNKIHTIAVTNAPSVFHFTANLAKEHSFVHPAAGLHPELVKTHCGELPLLIELIENTRFVGEVGLDFVTTNPDDRKLQEHVFGKMLEKCASVGGRILTIHSRRSSGRVIEMLENTPPGKAILHWFSGPKKDLLKAIHLGCWFSINPAMVRSQTGRALIARMPKDKTLLESDGPFVNDGGMPSTPSSIQSITKEISEIWDCTEDDVRKSVNDNFYKLMM